MPPLRFAQGRLRRRFTLPQAVACRTTPPSAGRVVQMASGTPDSLLNDSLFDAGSDCALRFSAGEVVLERGAPQGFRVQLRAYPEDPSASAMQILRCL